MRLITERQRTYVRSHPVVFRLCMGLFVTGLLGVLVPDSMAQSAVSAVLPAGIRTLFYLDYCLAAALCVLGQARGKAPLEAMGMGMLAFGFAAQEVAATALLGTPLPGIFLVFLAWGAFERGLFLRAYGYPPRMSR